MSLTIRKSTVVKSIAERPTRLRALGVSFLFLARNFQHYDEIHLSDGHRLAS